MGKYRQNIWTRINMTKETLSDFIEQGDIISDYEGKIQTIKVKKKS